MLTMATVRNGLRCAAILGLAALVAGCGSVPRTAYTADQARDATIPGVADARVFADASVETIAQLAANPEKRRTRFTYLALSGGGGDGAYGAGVLNGWTASGRDLNSPSSRGCPRARSSRPSLPGIGLRFLSHRILYERRRETLVAEPSITSVLFGSGLFGDGRLRDLIGRYLTNDLMDAMPPSMPRVAASSS